MANESLSRRLKLGVRHTIDEIVLRGVAAEIEP